MMQADNNKLRYLTEEVQKMMEGAGTQTFDAKADEGYDQPMTDITRQQVTDLLAASEAKMDARLANFDASIKTGFADIRAEFSSLRADSHKMNADIKSWTLATMLTIIGTMLAAIFGVATIFNNVSKSSAPTAPPVPIVIYTQPATTAAPPTATLPPAAQK